MDKMKGTKYLLKREERLHNVVPLLGEHPLIRVMAIPSLALHSIIASNDIYF
jgi:hypothetical protein